MTDESMDGLMGELDVIERSSGRGLWIALEGADGSGKSTQVRLLADALGAIHTFEPGNTVNGRAIRELVLRSEHPLSPRAEALLFAADRADHLEQVVEPAITGGHHVVSDRSVWSSVVYQGIGRGLGVEEVIAINDWACNGRFPEIVVYLRGDTSSNRRRIEERGRARDRIEQEGEQFTDAIHRGFEQLARERGWIVVDHGTVEEIHQRIVREVNAAITARTT